MRRRFASYFVIWLCSWAGVANAQEVKDGPARSTGYKPLALEQLKAYHALSAAKNGGRIPMLAKNQTLPASFDCRTKVPLPIWDQGNCGSCYLDSTIRCATCAGIFIGLGKADSSFMLAVQYGMDRPRNFGGCNGGNGTEVIAWAVAHGWVAEKYVDVQGVAHNDYPAYEARSGSDRTKAGAKTDWIKGWEWGFVNSTGKLSVDTSGNRHLSAPPTDQIKAAMFNHGRLNIALDAGGGFNASGTITSLGNNIDHEINMAGWDDNHDNGNGTKGAFLLENQWGEDWSGSGAGPGCKWCSYTAAQRIVDHFFISAGPLPPPPPDPVPPIPPGPGPSPSLLGKLIPAVDLKAGTEVWLVPAGYEVVPAGTKGTLDELKAILKRLQGEQETKEPPVIEPEKKQPPDPKEEKKEEQIEAKQDAKGVVFTIPDDMMFSEWRAKIIECGIPAVVGIGHEPPKGDWLSFRAPNRWHSYEGPGIVPFMPEGDVLWSWEYPIPANASAAAVAHKLASLAPKKKFDPYANPRDPKTGKILKKPK